MPSPRRLRPDRILPLLPFVGVAVTMVVTITVAGVLFFLRGRTIMEEQLKDKLRSTAAAAAMQFQGETIDRITNGSTMANSPALRDTVGKLQTLREQVTNVRFAYIMRRTDDPRLHEFAADADLALTPEELDRNQNGVVEDDETASQPGDTYDWTDFPLLGNEAFLHPAVDEHVGEDQWGPIISGYAPIRRQNGQTAAILGIDMDANEFTALSSSIFSPIALLLVILASVCIGAGTTLYLWRRRIENLNRLEIERSGLLRLAFHQLGGPLTIINWSLEELEEEGPASIQRTIVNLHEGVKRLGEILKTLKNADLVHAGKIEYKPEFASLTSVLEQIVRASGTKLAVRKQRVILDLEEHITMKLDPKLIAGVAEELLTNAIDFSPDGASITVSSRRTGRTAEFSVIDHGCGIPKQDLRRIFDEFSRGSNATRFKADGNGLGLYIVRGIVEQAGGTVTVVSREGKGTVVTVRLPIV